MPQCVKCRELFHPDYSVIIDHSSNACKCVFCYKNQDYIIIEDEGGGGKVEKVYKREAAEKYKEYLHKLKENDKIAKILGKHQQQTNPFAI